MQLVLRATLIGMRMGDQSPPFVRTAQFPNYRKLKVKQKGHATSAKRDDRDFCPHDTGTSVVMFRQRA